MEKLTVGDVPWTLGKQKQTSAGSTLSVYVRRMRQKHVKTAFWACILQQTR